MPLYNQSFSCRKRRRKDCLQWNAENIYRYVFLQTFTKQSNFRIKQPIIFGYDQFQSENPREFYVSKFLEEVPVFAYTISLLDQIVILFIKK